MTRTASEIATLFCEFLDKEKPAPSSRWLNLTNLFESFGNQRYEEGIREEERRWVTTDELQRIKEEVRREALEEAAKIADNYFPHTPNTDYTDGK